MLDKKVKAAVNVIDEICAKFQGTRQDHAVINSALQIIVAALEPPADKKGKKIVPNAVIKVPKKALPRDRKRKGKDKK